MLAASRWRGPASLGAKLVLFLTAAGLAGALAITVLLAAVITPSFTRLETQAIDAQVDRTQAMLADAGADIEATARDYGDVTSNVADLEVQGTARIAPDGRVIAADWPGDAGGIRHGAFVAALARLDPRVLASRESGYFFTRIGSGVAAIGVARPRYSDSAKDPREMAAMARMLSSRRVAELLRLNARVAPAAGMAVQITTPDSEMTDIRVPVLGVDRKPVASIRFGIRRDVSLLGRRMLLLAVAGSTVLLLIILVVLRRMIARQVLAPLHRVEAHMGQVRASGTMTLLEEDDRADEIGALGRAFNAMLRQLNDLREQIQAQSFALGRSESAVAVMHNVRNALNPVSTILSQGIAQAAPIDRAMLDRALVELAKDDLPAPRREKLTAFVATGVDAWAAGREAMKAELTVGREAMAHALEIIGQQQKQAHERPPLEPCDVTEIVARNATIARYSELASIAFSFPSTPHRVLANRVILSQVIGNLFGNAAEAIAAGGRGSGTISVAVAQEGEAVIVRIRDDGEGFDVATGRTLFERGFSTRAHKSGGLGLHWCANSMIAMDGSLRLDSAGRGHGAVAVLKLKAAEAIRAAA